MVSANRKDNLSGRAGGNRSSQGYAIFSAGIKAQPHAEQLHAEMNMTTEPKPVPSLERILSLAPEPDHYAGVDAEATGAYDALDELEEALQVLRGKLTARQQRSLDEVLTKTAGLWDAMADLHLSSLSLTDELVAWGRDWRRAAEPGLPLAARVRFAVEKANANAGKT